MKRLSMVLLSGVLLLDGCAPTTGNELDRLAKADLKIRNIEFNAWVADTEDSRQRGLMFVTNDQMETGDGEPRKGMLFVFSAPQILKFWMKNTVIPLDIAYIDSDGKIVKIYTMGPLDVTTDFSSGRPCLYALEVQGGVFSKLDIKEGDVVDIQLEGN